jgi:regulator of sigma E protease
MLVIAAGPVMNFILALLLFIIIFGVIGVATAEQPKIAQLMENHAAQEAGLLPGDLVTHINSKPVGTWGEFVQIVRDSGGEPLEFVVERAGERLEITVIPRPNAEGIFAIGVFPEVKLQRLPILTSIRYGFRQTIHVTGAILVNLYQLVTRQLPADDITGPIGIFYYVGQAAKQGLFDVLFLAALISINLGLFNLLPIPALDGSKLVFLGFEAIRRRPVDPQKENLVHLVGFVLLISLMVLVMYRDIVRYFIK